MYREPTVMGRKPGLKSMVNIEEEEVNIQPEQNEETRIQKNEERLRNLQDNFKHSNIQIIGVSEGEGEGKEIENLFQKIKKENFPNLAKETEFQEVQEVQRIPNKWDPRKRTPRHINGGKDTWNKKHNWQA